MRDVMILVANLWEQFSKGKPARMEKARESGGEWWWGVGGGGGGGDFYLKKNGYCQTKNHKKKI